MQITFIKISDEIHEVMVIRQDGSQESATLNSRSFLRHDLAHFAVEAEIPIKLGFWGAVAKGASLSGNGLTGTDIGLAESLAGPVQTMMRTEADSARYLDTLQRIQPQLATADLAERIHNRATSLIGHWRATPFGSAMTIHWAQ